MFGIKRLLSKRFNSTLGLVDAALKDAQQKKTTAKVDKIPIFTTGNMRVSPQKLNHLARLIKGMTIKEAKDQMSMVLKKRGVNVKRLLIRASSALRHNYNLKPQNYIIKEAWVGKGVYIKRLRIHGRGRTGKMTRPTAHLKIKLGLKDNTDPQLLALAHQFRRHKLFVTMNDSKPVIPAYPIWSSKSWKYVTSSKWVSPENALYNKKK